jgi:hypothetical protein
VSSSCTVRNLIGFRGPTGSGLAALIQEAVALHEALGDARGRTQRLLAAPPAKAGIGRRCGGAGRGHATRLKHST